MNWYKEKLKWININAREEEEDYQAYHEAQASI